MLARRATVSSAMMASASSFPSRYSRTDCSLMPTASAIPARDFLVADIRPSLEVTAEHQFQQRTCWPCAMARRSSRWDSRVLGVRLIEIEAELHPITRSGRADCVIEGAGAVAAAEFGFQIGRAAPCPRRAWPDRAGRRASGPSIQIAAGSTVPARSGACPSTTMADRDRRRHRLTGSLSFRDRALCLCP